MRTLTMIASQLSVAVMLAMTIAVPPEAFAAERQLPDEGAFPSLRGATGWLNSQPLTPADLRGKVVLVDFWTYTCVNWLRTLPYVRAWAAKYKDQGLIVIGVHSPEFSFEKDVDNVRWAAKNMNVDYPIAIDSNHAIWDAFNNQYWPALYLIDAHGRIRYHQFGEGEYEQSEKVIQRLLAENDARGAVRDNIAVNPIGIEVAADWDDLKSPENYLGHARTTNFFASPPGAVLNKPGTFTVPTKLRLNQWALSGDWTIRSEAIALNSANGRIAYRFHARDVNLVMGPAVRGKSVRFRVLIDGKPVSQSHGADVDENGNGTVTEQRVYQLIRQPKPIADRQLEIQFFDPAVEAFAFTFG